MTAERPIRARSPESSAPGDPDLTDVRAAQADHAAFAVLYRRYLDRVYGYAFYQLGDHHDAEDATARTFTAALRALPAFRDEGASFRAWLFRIGHHTISNARRSRARRRTEPLPATFDHPAPNADPAGIVGRAEELRSVLRAVSQLPDDRRQVVLLRFVDGLSSKEIGQVMDRSEGAARVLLHRALRDLEARLRG